MSCTAYQFERKTLITRGDLSMCVGQDFFIRVNLSFFLLNSWKIIYYIRDEETEVRVHSKDQVREAIMERER